jgi:cell wall-associated NlpC family hydrolase
VATSETDLAAARLLERMLTEPEFRVRFRRDPVSACREVGLDELAEEMALATGKAATTLYVRESRSSMAGALMAASMEGVGGLHDLADHVDIGSMPPAVSNVLTLHLMSVKGDVNPNIEFEPGAGAEISDPRVAAVLNKLAADHKLTVSASSDRGVDISAIDGQPVNVANFDARELAMRLQDLDPSMRPDEIGTPWAIAGRGYFTDAKHEDVLHIGFDARGKNASMQLMAVAEAHHAAAPDSVGYPGDDAPREQVAAWMAAAAEKRGLPGELPVMASLVESGMQNLKGGDRDSVGFFQMRVGFWNRDAYAGFPDDPGKQIDWFLDQAEAVKKQRLARGLPIDDPHQYGEWIADVERPAEEYRGRYQLRLDEAQGLLKHHAPVADAPAPPAATATPVDPGQFGADGTGGPPTPETEALLKNDNVVLDSSGIADLKGGRIDPRIVAVLTKLSHDHKITVSSMESDHPEFTTGGSVSNHHAGRAFDIAAIDGVPVNASNFDAREIAMKLQDLDPSIRPDEIGSPWAISGAAYFTDSEHQNHLHIGFDHEITPDFKPPADVAAAAAEPAVQRDTLGVMAPVGKTADVGHESLSFMAAIEPKDRAGAGAAADLAPGGDGSGAGAKALAALAEAKKYLGTPYQWGGSTPQTHFDCSGLVQWSYAQAGIQIPRVTDQQILAANATPVDRKHLLPGDLVFFRDPSGYVHHVGMSLGGDKFIHAPHTGDVVKISSLDEPYYAQQFTGGRRFDPAGAAPLPDPTEVAKAHAHVARDAAEVRRQDSALFMAVKAQEAAKAHATVQFLKAIDPDQAKAAAQPLGQAPLDLGAVPGDYPGNDASQAELAKWLAKQAEQAGLPPELPVMASLVESGVKNLSGGDRDSVGFFQMRVGTWNSGPYAGYPDRPELQAKWFIDQALAIKRRRIAAGDVNFGKDPAKWGEWIADVERPAEQYRGRYQLRLGEARGLLG